MYKVEFTSTSPAEFYRLLLEHAATLYRFERDYLANLANTASLIGLNMPQINWAGFYLHRQEQLILGPFWGKPACSRIIIGSGVCGTAAEQRVAQLVDDVSLFPGHIACDEASASELVIPLLAASGELLGVLDIDSPLLSRFTDEDLAGMSALADLLITSCDWEQLR